MMLVEVVEVSNEGVQGLCDAKYLQVTHEYSKEFFNEGLLAEVDVVYETEEEKVLMDAHRECWDNIKETISKWNPMLTSTDGGDSFALRHRCK